MRQCDVMSTRSIYSKQSHVACQCHVAGINDGLSRIRCDDGQKGPIRDFTVRGIRCAVCIAQNE